MTPEILYLYLYHFQSKEKISKILQNFWFRGSPSPDRDIYNTAKRISGSTTINIRRFVRDYVANPKIKLNEIYDDKRNFKKNVRRYLTNNFNEFILGMDGIQLSQKQIGKIAAMVNKNIDKKWK